MTTQAQRAVIAEDADDQQDGIVASVLEYGFSIDWNAVARETADAEEPLNSVRLAVERQLRSRDFRETVQALDVNGRLLAAYTQQQHERLAGLRLPATVTFAEPQVYTPERAVAYWKQKLGLSDSTAAGILESLGRGDSNLLGLQERISKSVMDRVTKLFEEAIAQGISKSEFARRLQEIPTPKGWSGGLEDVTNAVMETEYRTNLTEAYSESAHQLVLERAAAFPFLQFMIVRDSRVTWWICLPMGTAGPGGKGYICATTDPLPNTVWRLPAHYRCRSAWSPISYLEARRMGILARDGRTKIAIEGYNPMRPFGDPPEFATHPETGEKRRVEPQEGFGGGGSGAAIVDVQQVVVTEPPARKTPAPLRPDATSSAPAPPAPEEKPAQKTAAGMVPKSDQWVVAESLGMNPDPPPSIDVARMIFAAFDSVDDGAGIVPIGRVRDAAAISGAEFDRAVLGLWWNGNVQLQSNPTPSLDKPENQLRNPRDPGHPFSAMQIISRV